MTAQIPGWLWDASALKADDQSRLSGASAVDVAEAMAFAPPQTPCLGAHWLIC